MRRDKGACGRRREEGEKKRGEGRGREVYREGKEDGEEEGEELEKKRGR